MTKHELNTLLEKVSELTPHQQEQVMQIVEQLSVQKTDTHRLTDAQLKEVERRLADPEPRFITISEARSLLRRPGV